MDIQELNNNGYVSPVSSQTSTGTTASSATTSVAPTSVDVSVEISPQAQQLALESIQQTTVTQASDISTLADSTVADPTSESQFGTNATVNNSALAAEVSGTSGATLNGTPSNSSQSASVASQYNVSPDTALGQTIDFSA
ncbi:hypothetical protein ACFQ45_05450 [Rhodanobacter aciditrophus]|uniref:Uncharacterized protein n=1 Tax=Rhodanobacter aciditrophus TaxID=1623218 RepID=A0ABW4AZP9_9GAMM